MAKPPKIESRPHPLVGCCFMIRSSEGEMLRQGIVRAVVEGPDQHRVLVQYFEALMGYPNTLSLIPMAEMVPEPTTGGKSGSGGPGGWVFFEDDEHLRNYCETYQTRRDRRISSKREGSDP